MARIVKGYIVKGYEERKAEILNTAQGLFMTRGYGSTSVNMIIEAIGISKGAFYHYFKSKEDLLDQLVTRMAQVWMDGEMHLADDSSLDAIEKFNHLFNAARDWKTDNRQILMEAMRVLYSDENLLMRRKMLARNLQLVVPIYTRIIEQGNKEGLFDVRAPEFTAELIVHMFYSQVDAIFQYLLDSNEHPENLDKIRERMENLQEACTRVLGTHPGRLAIVNDEFVRVMAAWREEVSPEKVGAHKEGKGRTQKMASRQKTTKE